MKILLILIFLFPCFCYAQQYGWVPTGKYDTVVKKTRLLKGSGVIHEFSYQRLWRVRAQMKYVPKPGEPGEHNKRDFFYKPTDIVLASDKKTRAKSTTEPAEQ